MFVQRDFLIRQIEMAAAGLARLVAGERPGEDLDPSEVARAAGLGLDIARSLPLETVAGLVDHDGQKLLVLGLALGREAWETEQAQLARTALRLIDRALHGRDPVAPTADILSAQQALLGLAFG